MSSAMNLRKKSQNQNQSHFAEINQSEPGPAAIQSKLRSQLQDQMFMNDGLKSQLFQKQLENEDLRQRLVYLETICGRDSSSIKDMITEETSNVDWARILLDQSTDDMIINVSREKIAHELIRLRTEVKNLRSGAVQVTAQSALNFQSDRQANNSSSQSSFKQSSLSEGPGYLKQNKYAAYGHKASARSGSNATPNPTSRELGMLRLETLPPRSQRGASNNISSKIKKKSRVNILYPSHVNNNPYEN